MPSKWNIKVQRRWVIKEKAEINDVIHSEVGTVKLMFSKAIRIMDSNLVKLLALKE